VKGKGRNRFSSYFPRSNGILSFSRVGFDSTLHEANVAALLFAGTFVAVTTDTFLGKSVDDGKSLTNGWFGFS
jgi:hypothetical protein